MNNLQQLTIADYQLPNGKKQTFYLTYQIVGKPLHSAPIVLINHALTGNSEVAGANGWWKSLVDENQVIDLKKYTVIAFDIPGNGFDQQSEHLIKNYQDICTLTVAQLFWKGLHALNITQLYAIVGGSLGGSIAWQMAFLAPNAIEHLVPIATNYKASDWLIGNVLVQDNILNHSSQPIEDARIHAMLLYRTPASFQEKFQQQWKEEEQQYTVESWLKYHGKTLQKRFALDAYLVMNHLLKTIGQHLNETQLIAFAKTTNAAIHVIAVDTDYMFTNVEQKQTADCIKPYNNRITYQEIKSIHGHDAFLMEYKQLNQLLQPLF